MMLMLSAQQVKDHPALFAVQTSRQAASLRRPATQVVERAPAIIKARDCRNHLVSVVPWLPASALAEDGRRSGQ